MLRFAIISNDGTHEYDLEVVEHGQYNTTYTLKYSNGSIWSEHVKGTVAMSIQDDGNGHNITFSDGTKDLADEVEYHLNIDYSDVEKLNVLYRAMAALGERSFQKFKMVPLAKAIDL